jgi:hypothetical protein
VTFVRRPGNDVDSERDDDEFDPVGAGERYNLSPMVSLAIWQRVRDEASHGDELRAHERFIASRHGPRAAAEGSNHRRAV